MPPSPWVGKVVLFNTYEAKDRAWRNIPNTLMAIRDMLNEPWEVVAVDYGRDKNPTATLRFYKPQTRTEHMRIHGVSLFDLTLA
jgi:hypothetical protein